MASSSSVGSAALRDLTVSLLVVVALAGGAANAETGSAACAPCHAGIYAAYMRTPMAMSSGRTGSGLFAESFENAEFSRAPSDVRYRAYRNQSRPAFSFDLNAAGSRIQGNRLLEYFVGSGTVGRSYAFSVGGFLYQAPVSYYSAKQSWDLSPGYQDYDHLYLTRPVEPACLRCHASRLQPIAGTLNGFAEPAFLEGGISCERCHGAGEDHIEKVRTGADQGGLGIVNPRRLPPDRRDGVCAQCHLSGVARIDALGRSQGSYAAGAPLSDHLAVFVWSRAPAEMKVTSHYEKLAESRCKIQSGDRLWCGSCHDAHSLPAEDRKAAYFQSKCLECHSATAPCKASARVRDIQANRCADCHMPKNPVTDVAHAVYTDHSIPRRAAVTRRPVASTQTLVPFGGGKASDRDLGLAYAFVVESDRNPIYDARAFELLKRAVAQDPSDIPAAVQLARLYDSRGREDEAMALYQKAVGADPSQVVAAANLGTHLMKKGLADQAVRLWSDVLARSPGLEIARMNLALAKHLAGDSKSAEQVLQEGLDLNPGAIEMRRLWNRVRQSNPR